MSARPEKNPLYWYYGSASVAFGIKNAGQVVCLDLGTGPPHHIDHAIDCTGRLSSRISEVWHAMKGPIEVTGAVYQQESMFSHTAIVQSSCLTLTNRGFKDAPTSLDPPYSKLSMPFKLFLWKFGFGAQTGSGPRKQSASA